MSGSTSAPPRLVELAVAGEPAAWEAAGFALAAADPAGPATVLGDVRILLVGRDGGRGIARWTLAGAGTARSTFDGLPTELVDSRPSLPPWPPHPNGVTAIDHVVAFSPDLDRTVSVLRDDHGLDFRRLREGPTAAGAQRQAFFRVGEPLLEVIEHPPDVPAAADRAAPSRFWGLALLAPDLEATAQRLGALLGEPRPAIQPGRRIATFTREAGLGLPVALISPRA